MPRFWYRTDAADSQQCFIEAANLPDAILKLRAAGVTITAAGAETPPASPHYCVRRSVQAMMFGQLAALLEDGTPLPIALRKLAGESRDRYLQRSLGDLADQVDQGRSLSEAMTLQASVYAPQVISAIAATEEGGDLPAGLRSLTRHQEEISKLASQLSFPLLYPLIITFLVFGLVTFMVTFILPKYISLFKELGMTEDKFPLPTLLLMKLAHVVPLAVIFVGIPALCLIFAYIAYSRSRRGHFEMQLWGLHIPIWGQLSLYTALGRMASALSLLLQHGVQMGKALRLAGDASGNEVLSIAMRRAATVVNQGGSLSEGLREAKILPEDFIFSLGAAEVGGELPTTLRHIFEEYERQAQYLARAWITVAGPVIVFLLGGMVGFIGVSMFLPLIGIIGELSK